MSRRPTLRVRGELVTDATTRLLAKVRRDELRARGLCINGETHGDATHGVLCRRCRAKHRGVPVEAVAVGVRATIST